MQVEGGIENDPFTSDLFVVLDQTVKIRVPDSVTSCGRTEKSYGC